MSHFYGVITGSRNGTATRCGHKSTGLRTRAQTHRGSIEVALWYNDTTGKDHYQVSKRGPNGRTVVLAEGVFEQE